MKERELVFRVLEVSRHRESIPTGNLVDFRVRQAPFSNVVLRLATWQAAADALTSADGQLFLNEGLAGPSYSSLHIRAGHLHLRREDSNWHEDLTPEEVTALQELLQAQDAYPPF